MSKKDAPKRISYTPSPQSYALLDELTKYGIYGRTRADIVNRVVDRYLAENFATKAINRGVKA